MYQIRESPILHINAGKCPQTVKDIISPHGAKSTAPVLSVETDFSLVDGLRVQSRYIVLRAQRDQCL